MLATLISATALAADSIDLSGQWSCQLAGTNVPVDLATAPFPAAKPVHLPGTLDEAGLGEPVTKPDYGCLSRRVRFIGQAWYRRDITVPAAWQDREVELVLERVLWTSEVWLDGQPVGTRCDSLATPHLHKLGKLSPGKHALTLRIDNTMVHRIGDKGHVYGDHMQTIWNGAIGKLELRLVDPLDGMKVTSPWPTRELGLELPALVADGWKVEIVDLHDRKTVQDSALKLEAGPGATTKVKLSLAFEPKPWDEFSPALYLLKVTALRAGKPFATKSIRFGFRSIERRGNRVFLNGRPFFMRGNTDNCHFPLTGYPAMDFAAWKRIFQTLQQNGVNFIRFHSWCPPPAAFDAADELGLYLQPETLWIDGWMPGNPKGLGKGDADLDGFIQAEMRRINDAYGNSPAYLAFCIGNELGNSDYDAMSKWITVERAYDPRRLYACSTARQVTPADDYAVTHDYPGIGGVRQWMNSHTAWDYEKPYSRTKTPCVAHEIGQWPVYPDYAEAKKYTGVLRAWNYEGFRGLAATNNTLRFNREFQETSLKQNLMLYKDEVEAFLRTPSCAGVCLLGMQDYSGQGEALIGWLDNFYHDKGVPKGWEARNWFAPTVPLASFPKYVWATSETYQADILVHHYGAAPIPAGTRLDWSVATEKGKRCQSGTLELKAPLQPGTVTKVGAVAVPLSEFPANAKYVFEVQIKSLGRLNHWPLWVLPASIDAAAPATVVLTDDLVAAQSALRAGKTVVLGANSLGRAGKFVAGDWGAVYWSTTWFKGQAMQTLGLWLDQSHPALADFPAASYGDWLWRDICSGGRAFMLDGLPRDFRPVAMPVSDFHQSLLLGTIFELQVGKGKLLVCGYDLDRNYLGTRQLRRSLLDYAASPKFQPSAAATPEWLDQLLGIPPVKAGPRPAEYQDARVYIECAANSTQAGDVKWKRNLDRADLPAGLSYEFSGTTWHEEAGSYWVGWRQFSFSMHLQDVEPGRLLVRFRDPNHNGRSGKGTFEGRLFDIPVHQDKPDGTFWLEQRVDREDGLDGVLKFDATVLSGPNLMIDRVILMPNK